MMQSFLFKGGVILSFIDIHSHILPYVDDGAKSIEESIELLKQEKEQGVDAVICTPHFYPRFSSLDEHLQSTTESFKLLKEAARGLNLPELFLGHEVQSYPNISRSSSLEVCALSNSYYLLLELPFLDAIPKETIDDISRLSENLGFRIILAHIERYSSDKNYKKLINFVKRGIVLAQVNADSFFLPKLKKPVEKLLKANLVSFVASDAHSPTERPVRIREFIKAVSNTYPAAYSKIIRTTDSLFNELKGETYAY